jgi:hypothetical protein
MDGPETHYVVALRVRCAGCHGELIYELPAAIRGIFMPVSQAKGGTEARLVGRMALQQEEPDALWTQATTRTEDVPPQPENPTQETAA